MGNDYYNYYGRRAKIEDMLGQTFTSVSGGVDDSDAITFVTNDGYKFIMAHNQDCCESVTIEDISGDLEDLVGSPITLATEITSNEAPYGRKDEYHESETWTFYRLGTIKGTVVIRWYGSSNGYYSESVDLYKVKV